MWGTRKLAVLTPSRGRPGELTRLADALAANSRSGSTDLIAAVDHDDPQLPGYSPLAQRPGVRLCHGDRRSMSAWTNLLWQACQGGYEYFASLGDDHVPRTAGWDTSLIAAIEALGGTGFAYGNDLLQGPDLPTAWIVSANIPAALGWVTQPGMQHYCVDNVTKDLGDATGLLAYCGHVVIAHEHWINGRAVVDQTYADAGHFSVDHYDYMRYQEWRRDRLAADAAAIAKLIQDRV